MRWSARGEGEKRHPQHPLVRSRKLHSSPTSRATSPSASSSSPWGASRRRSERRRARGTSRTAAPPRRSSRRVPSLPHPAGPARRPRGETQQTLRLHRFIPPPAAPAPTPSISRLLFFPRAPSRRPSRRPPRVFSSLLFSSRRRRLPGPRMLAQDRARCRPALQARGQERGFQARSTHWSPYDRVGVVNADP